VAVVAHGGWPAASDRRRSSAEEWRWQRVAGQQLWWSGLRGMTKEERNSTHE